MRVKQNIIIKNHYSQWQARFGRVMFIKTGIFSECLTGSSTVKTLCLKKSKNNIKRRKKILTKSKSSKNIQVIKYK